MKNIVLNIIAIVAAALFWQINIFADDWVSPHEFDAFSQSGNVVAHVIPSKKDSAAKLAVYALQDGKRKLLWAVDLSNLVSPVKLYVADNGKNVGTFDNWGGAGYGKDVAAVYNKDGQLKKYSLEELFPQLKNDDALNKYQYLKKLPISASSRRWRTYSYGFFDEKEPIFCLWIDWDARWIAWNMETGELHAVSADQKNRWDTRCRAIMLDLIKNGKADILEFEFLGKLKNPQDKPLIQKLLNDTDFKPGYSTVSDSITFTSESPRRRAAEKILAKWENDQADVEYRENYVFLGSAELTVVFPSPPKKDEGNLIVYLVEDSTGLLDVKSSIPQHYLFLDLKSFYPFNFNKIRSSQLSKTVNFSIKGITPGKYKVIAVWDREKPFMGEKPPFIPAKGDIVSDDTVKIEIKAGQTTKNVSIQCTNPIK